MDVILSPINGDLHFDDIFMFSYNTGEFISHVITVLSCLHKAAVLLRPYESEFPEEKTEDLERVIRPGSSELADHTTDTIGDLKHGVK